MLQQRGRSDRVASRSVAGKCAVLCVIAGLGLHALGAVLSVPHCHVSRVHLHDNFDEATRPSRGATCGRAYARPEA